MTLQTRFYSLIPMGNDHYNYDFSSNVIKILMQNSYKNNAIAFIIFISIEREYVSFAETFKSL